MSADRGNEEKPNFWQRWVIRAASTRWGTWILSRCLPLVDLPLLRYARRSPVLSRFLAGLPLLTLTTVGVKTGRTHTVPLLFVRHRDAIVLIASNWGRPRMPGWYHNLKANPSVRLNLNGGTGDYVAREAEGDERELAWQKAVDLYPGYASYARQAGRRIPVLIMTPAGAAGEDSESAGEAYP